MENLITFPCELFIVILAVSEDKCLKNNTQIAEIKTAKSNTDTMKTDYIESSVNKMIITNSRMKMICSEIVAQQIGESA
ncbi:hypothetical protein Smp_125570 [Schistosoma mansoni]|uniref:hypothetical protein n=1 Tax=Schistosoma mansoni TaxID=6183 RepID=UPI0001A63834|nr:hypothetical protein Smp_125570 [Schistosoma mansoni]|eukprot:XP_018654110.1 hypothetical protein Smp_125570 [Schistosoma mansoni]